MTKKKDPNLLPLRVHKATQQAYVLIDGARHYLGRNGTPETQARYDKFLMEWLARGRRMQVPETDVTIVEVVAAFKAHVERTYNDDRTLQRFKSAWVPLVELYGHTAAAEFGPLKLKAVRERLILGKRGTRTRQYVNTLIGSVKHLFKWAASEELVPTTIFHGLQTVAGLRHGRTEAREADAVKPVPQEQIDAIRPFVSRQVEALIDLQLLTAARPGELVIMRPIDIDTTGRVWIYKPTAHKTAHHGHSRLIYLGPKAQKVVRPFLAGRAVEAFLFSPAEAVAEQRKERSAERVTPLSCGNKRGTNVKRNPKKTAGVRYTPRSYYGAIIYACRRVWPCPPDVASAGPEAVALWKRNKKAMSQWHAEHRWHPHQLRHNAATSLRKQFGLDVAAIMLGHARCDVTQIYAEKNHEAAMQIAAKVG